VAPRVVHLRDGPAAERAQRTLLLFRVYDRMSYGLVVESIHAIREGDYLKHPAFGHRDTGLSDFAR